MVYHRGLGNIAHTVGLTGSSLPVCVDPQAKNIVIACLIGAILAVAFAPGYLKLAAAPLAAGAYWYCV